MCHGSHTRHLMEVGGEEKRKERWKPILTFPLASTGLRTLIYLIWCNPQKQPVKMSFLPKERFREFKWFAHCHTVVRDNFPHFFEEVTLIHLLGSLAWPSWFGLGGPPTGSHITVQVFLHLTQHSALELPVYFSASISRPKVHWRQRQSLTSVSPGLNALPGLCVLDEWGAPTENPLFHAVSGILI